MEVGNLLPLGRRCQLLALALSEADDLAVGRGDDDLALGDGRGGRHGRGGFVFPDFLAAGEGEPVTCLSSNLPLTFMR
jgi:hypothetical protein